MTGVPSSDLKAYFAEARSWDQDRLQAALRSKRLAWGVAGGASALAMIAVAAVAALSPLKSVQPFVVRVDRTSGAVDVIAAEQGALPDWTPATQAWSSWSPADWDPYARRARFFRTPNDAALTQFSRPARPFLGPLDGLLVNADQIALVNSLAGAFHPTFQAHARMGLSVAAELQRALP